jgi:glycine dehydrogenase subunit 2
MGEHPYQPQELSQGMPEGSGYAEQMLAEITGMDAVTLQPAAGAHGELTGILLIRALSGQPQGNARKKLLIPDSAHGTNPATAVMAGYAVENIKSNALGMVDVDELARAVDEDVAALMLTNPNTLGVFEVGITRIAEILHAKGAQLYMDGANMNALVGIARPGDFGADVMHLNLHKTFSTPHGGGGPGSGPVAVKRHLIPFLPQPRLARMNDRWAWNYDLNRNPSAACAPFYGNVGMHVRALAYIMASRRRRSAQRHARRRSQFQLSARAAGRLTTICRTNRPRCTNASSATRGRAKFAECAPATSPSA